MTSVLAISANQAQCLYDGINSLYLKGSNLYLFDGEQEVMFEGGKNGKDGQDGQDGNDGANGADGKSAFEIWKEQQPERFNEEEELIVSIYDKDKFFIIYPETNLEHLTNSFSWTQ